MAHRSHLEPVLQSKSSPRILVNNFPVARSAVLTPGWMTSNRLFLCSQTFCLARLYPTWTQRDIIAQSLRLYEIACAPPVEKSPPSPRHEAPMALPSTACRCSRLLAAHPSVLRPSTCSWLPCVELPTLDASPVLGPPPSPHIYSTSLHAT